MASFWQDVRYGLRMLRKNPGFTTIALVTLTVGIGANTIMFSISDLLRLRPRHAKDPGQLAYCAIQDAYFGGFRHSAYLTVRDSGLAFRDLMAQSDDPRPTTLVDRDSVRQVRATYVSANYFSFLGVTLAQGRGFLPAEEHIGGTPVVVLEHRMWQRLGADPNIVGQFLSANGVRCQVVGVAAEGFTGVTILGPDLWLPLGSHLPVAELARGHTPRANAGPDRNYPVLDLVGRLKPGVRMSVAQAQLQALVPRFKQEYPRQWRDHSTLALRPPARLMIYSKVEDERLAMAIFSAVLMAVSAIILLIACLNLANMLIVQGASRHREIGIRMVLGATKGNIMRMVLREGLLLTVVGLAVGLLLGLGVARVSVSLLYGVSPLDPLSVFMTMACWRSLRCWPATSPPAAPQRSIRWRPCGTSERRRPSPLGEHRFGVTNRVRCPASARKKRVQL